MFRLSESRGGETVVAAGNYVTEPDAEPFLTAQGFVRAHTISSAGGPTPYLRPGAGGVTDDAGGRISQGAGRSQIGTLGLVCRTAARFVKNGVTVLRPDQL